MRKIWKTASFFTAALTLSAGLLGGLGTSVNVSAASAASPATCIDSPRAGSVYKNGSVTVSGWAISPSGVSRVDFYVKDSGGQRFVGSDSTLTARPDVVRSVDPNHRCQGSDQSGFSLTVPANAVRSGSVTVSVANIAKNGTVQWKSVGITMQKPAPRMVMDAPQNGTKIGNYGLTVRGWALNGSGVSRVDFYVRDSGGTRFLGTDGSLSARPDVARIIDPNGQYPGSANSGFSLNVAASQLRAGGAAIMAAAIGNDGSVQWATAGITVVKLSPLMSLDSPRAGANYQNSGFTVSGWALSPNGVSRVDFYVKDSGGTRFLGTDGSLSARADVVRSVDPNHLYQGSDHSGFSLNVSPDQIHAGSATIMAAAVGNDGVATWRTAVITMVKPAPQMCIDAPANGSWVTSAALTVSGWAVNASGIANVKLKIDNGSLITVPGGLSRGDVGRAYPQYENSANSGFSVDIPGLSAGTHTVTVVATGRDGTALTRSVSVKKAETRVYFDTPTDSANYGVGADVKLAGWAITPSGIKSLTAQLDSGAPVTLTPASSSDLVGKFTGYGDLSDCRFQYDYGSIATVQGVHTITVTVTGNDGLTSSGKVIFTVGGKLQYTPYNITLAQMLSYQQTFAANNGAPKPSSGDVDPSAILKSDSDSVYQFLRLDTFQTTTMNGTEAQVVASLNTMLQNCGTLTNQGQAFFDAAKATGVSPVYLAAHARIESGNGSSKLATGKDKNGNFTGYYNFYGIGAYDSDPVTGGQAYAKANGWNTIAAAVKGGAQWIANNYIRSSLLYSTGYDQNTLYKMRWDPFATANIINGVKKSNGQSYSRPNEYAIDLDWACGISNIMAQYPATLNLCGPELFDIPQYKS